MQLHAKYSYLHECFRLELPLFLLSIVFTAQKMKFSIKDFFSKCEEILINSIKKETLAQVFPVNFAKFLRTPFFTERLR